jgi:aminoglycoside 6'-N-acetyltransferase
LNNPDVTQCLEVRHAKQNRESIEMYMHQRGQDSETGWHFGVFDQEGTRHVGTVTMNGISKFYLTADISFVMGHPQAQGRGYATEAVHAVCFYAFRTRGLHKITGGHYASNVGSFRVFQKNGFRLEGSKKEQVINAEGEREDVLIHGLLAREFIEKETGIGMIPPTVILPHD